MNLRRWSLIALGAAAIGLATVRMVAGPVPAAPLTGANERVPVLVELFTSEGCSSCPPADQVLTRFVDLQPVPGADVIALGEHVDYWDRLGWRDPFSSAAFTARQTDYASQAFHGGDVYTPQIVVDGHEAVVGSDYRAATNAIARAARASGPRLRIALSATRVGDSSVRVTMQVDPVAGVSLSRTAESFVALTEDGLVTQVRRRENSGRELHHSAVTRVLSSVGAVRAGAAPWTTSTTVPLAREWNLSRLRLIAFVQDRATRAVLGATNRSSPRRSPSRPASTCPARVLKGSPTLVRSHVHGQLALSAVA